MNKKQYLEKDSTPRKGIRVKALSTLQDVPRPQYEEEENRPEKNSEQHDAVIILSSDSEDELVKQEIPLSVKRRRRKRSIAMKLEKVDEESRQKISSNYMQKHSRKQQKINNIASKCYRMEDYFNPLSKKEWTQAIHKNYDVPENCAPEDVSGLILQNKRQQKQGKQERKNEMMPLRQFTSTRMRNPVTNIFIRRKLSRTTNVKMLGKSHLTDQQKRIHNYFTVYRGSTFRSYYDTFRESLFPVLIAGELNVNNFLSKLLEETNEGQTGDMIFDYSLNKDKLILQPKKGCTIDDEVHMLEIFEKVIKEEGVDLEVNPCDQDKEKKDTYSEINILGNEANSTEAKDENSKELKQEFKVQRGRKVVCPPFKIIKGTTFAVDAFRYGNIQHVTHYFLTHFHADHYCGLRKTFNKPVYLTTVTANLVKSFVKVKPQYLIEMKYNIPVIINGVEVIALDANHCPGAAMFVFKLPNGENILHTGDFRATYLMEMLPILWNNYIDIIYLDTTYLSSQTILPSQDESIDMAIEETEKFLTRNIGQKCLIIVGTYIVGKERVWHTLATRFGFRVWLEGKRRQAVECMENPRLLEVLSADPCNAQIHVLPLGKLSYDYVVHYMSQFENEFTHVLAIRPSGWEVNSRPRHQGNISIVGVTYSEHSSYTELRRFVRFLRPRCVIPTVNAEGMREREKIPEKWLSKKIEPWREMRQSTITVFFPLKRQQRTPEEDKEAEVQNLTQFSLVVQCDKAEIDSRLTD